MRAVDNMETVAVECECGAKTVMPAAYAKYVKGKIGSCKECR